MSTVSFGRSDLMSSVSLGRARARARARESGMLELEPEETERHHSRLWDRVIIGAQATSRLIQ